MDIIVSKLYFDIICISILNLILYRNGIFLKTSLEVHLLPRKGLLEHLQTQQEGKRNQSMKMPAQSLLGS